MVSAHCTYEPHQCLTSYILASAHCTYDLSDATRGLGACKVAKSNGQHILRHRVVCVGPVSNTSPSASRVGKPFSQLKLLSSSVREGTRPHFVRSPGIWR